MTELELLAPAKNLECGIAAIDHGADAVYIGAPRFGARAAAANSLEDIKKLCDYAHQFRAKVHVTVNTIIYENEMEDTLKMIAELDRIGVDALLLQDMGVLWDVRANQLWHRELHSSTQCDARSADKVAWLSTLGFDRVVLARELSLDEIREIHKKNPSTQLEAFVHGALCVSYSGVCYASEKCFGRSANRGECAQFCRMKFNLIDSNENEIEHERHLLSLKDLCQIDHLQELADAGATSFKIEGRLKDVNYVKNVVAAYSRKLDEIVAANPDKYCRASFGRAIHTFQPNLKKTFNRGFTNYFLNGRQPDIASFDTPKAMGEYVGKVKEIRGNISFNVATVASFANGDGLCFINDEKELEGFRVNRVEGNRLYPLRMPEHLRPGMALYRNNDQAFENVLSKKTASRKIPLHIRVTPQYSESGALQQVLIEIGASVNVPQLDSMTTEGFLEKHLFYKIDEYSYDFEAPLELARRPQGDNIRQQLSKMGNTIFECDEVVLAGDLENYFIPNSVLSEIRRDLIETATEGIQNIVDRSLVKGVVEEIFSAPYQLNQAGEHELKPEEFVWQPAYGKWPYLYNIANRSAEHFYKTHGMKHIESAFEVEQPKGESLIMQCRHCIRYSLGYCVKRGGKKPQWKEPLFLELGDGRRFRLEFNCAECQMNVYSTK
ncbi:U32 family peptidase [Prevotella copri]|uniref:U32 family peptidase n=1 Tax=Segatella copri TaxID=165179 RepID=A0AA90UDL3_9BACT|nr:U32 family peptidase [Segatella copri]MQN11649.1 U32 family peptidase [Segatella copri]